MSDLTFDGAVVSVIRVVEELIAVQVTAMTGDSVQVTVIWNIFPALFAIAVAASAGAMKLILRSSLIIAHK